MASKWDINKPIGISGIPNLRLRWPRGASRSRHPAIVYYLERSSGAIKIGTTTNFGARKTAIAAAHGPVNLVAFEFGSYAAESARHEQFAHLRRPTKHGAEWFDPDPDLYDHILMLLAHLS